MGFPGGSVVKNSACQAGDLGSIPGSERSLVVQWLIPCTPNVGAWVQSLVRELDPICATAAAAAAAAAKSLQSCLTVCDPIDGSPPGSPVPGILQARTLEWVAISFSNA